MSLDRESRATASTPAHTRRRSLGLAGGVGLGLLGAACAPGDQGAQSQGKGALSDAPVTLQFVTRSGKTEDEINGILGDWYAAHPSWKVQVTRGVDQTKLNALAAADEKMDVLGWFQAARTVILLLNNLRPIDDYVKRDRYNVQQFSPKEVDLVGRHEGKLWALPYAYGGNATALFYNRNLFREAGLPEPPTDWSQAWTWEPFRETLRKLTRRSGSSTTQVGLTGIGDPITSLLVLSDGKWISDDWKKAQADNPETMQTFERYAELILKDGVMQGSPGTDLGSGNAFLNGKAAMHTICCGPLAFSRQLEPTGIDWAFAPMPKMKHASFDLQSVVLMLPRNGANPDHAWELSKYLIDDSRFGALEERMPAVLEDAPVWVREVYKDKPNVRAQVLADGVKTARPVDKIKYHPATQEMYDAVVQPALKEIWAGNQTVKSSFATLQSQLQTIIDRSPGAS
jgi:multiple sugar transport system substrate-binding protein